MYITEKLSSQFAFSTWQWCLHGSFFSVLMVELVEVEGEKLLLFFRICEKNVLLDWIERLGSQIKQPEGMWEVNKWETSSCDFLSNIFHFPSFLVESWISVWKEKSERILKDERGSFVLKFNLIDKFPSVF
jgi:hypothetical protein